MKVYEVLAIHNSSAAEVGNPDILGDPFLMRENSVYRNIKTFALEIGCTFTEAWPQYLLLPFHQLNHIVATKTVPYVPSARMLQELENKRPRVFEAENLRMPESYHLHESAHVIAEYFFADVRVSGSQEKILKMIICESFANSVDALACVAAIDETHRYFLEHNCYMHPKKAHADLMARLSRSLGLKPSFMFVLLAYLHANFMQEGVSLNLWQGWLSRYAPGVKWTQELESDCMALAEMSEELDPLFRVQTTELYLKMEGYEGEVFDLLNFPFMPLLLGNKGFLDVLDKMSDVVAR